MVPDIEYLLQPEKDGEIIKTKEIPIDIITIIEDE